MRYIDDAVAFRKFLVDSCGCINAGQSSEERRFKYAIAIALGKNPSWARVLRDYRRSFFARYFGYSSWENLMKVIKGSVK